MAPAIASLALILAGCTTPEEKLIATAQAAVASKLRDPTSPLFTNVTATENGLEVCGQVNAKNGFGAYAGKDRFIYNTATGAEIEPSENQPAGKLIVCAFDNNYRACKGEVVPSYLEACGQHLVGRRP